MNNNTNDEKIKGDKKCVVCGVLFQTNYKRKKACSPECKREMDNDRSKNWREANQDQYHKTLKRWRVENKEHKSLLDKKYRENNKEHLKQTKKSYYDNHQEEREEYRRVNSKHRNEYMVKYRKENKILFQEKEARRTAIKKNAYIEEIDRSKILKLQKNKCKICEKELLFDENKAHPDYPNLDHIVPLSKGGFHGMENAQYLCKDCNIRKNNIISDKWGNRNLYEKFKSEGKIIEVVEKKVM